MLIRNVKVGAPRNKRSPSITLGLVREVRDPRGLTAFYFDAVRHKSDQSSLIAVIRLIATDIVFTTLKGPKTCSA